MSRKVPWKMIIETITVTAFQQQTRILGCEETGRAICVDPGDDTEEIAGALRSHGLDL